MKKLLALLNCVNLGIAPTLWMISCNDTTNFEINEKLEVNPKNLAKFFLKKIIPENIQENIFFKDIKDQTNENQSKIYSEIRQKLINLISDLILPKFLDTFNYNPSYYFIGFTPLCGTFNLNGIEFNKIYELKFEISFWSTDQTTLYFIKENLILKFIQTAMYDKKHD